MQISVPHTHTSFIDLQKNELRNATLQNLGADIGTPVDGLIFYRTDTDRVRVRANGAWIDLATTADAGSGIPGTTFQAKGDLLLGTADDAYAVQAVGANGTVLVAASGQANGVEWRVLAPADITFAASDRLLGRDTAAGGTGEEITVAGGLEFTGSGGIQRSALTGDATATAGSNALTIPAGTVTLAKMANLAANSIIGNNTGGAAPPLALTTAQTKTLLAIVAADVSDFNTAVRTNRLDQMAAPTAPVAFNAQKITGLADGTAATDGATFGQLNAVVTGMKWKDTVDFASTGNITIASPGSGPFDGVTPAVGDRFLAKDQSTASQNGVYIWNGAATPATRATDTDTATEINDATVLVDAGTLAAGDIYTQTATVATLGTDTVTWTKTGEGNTVYTADGTTLTLTGVTFSITALGVGTGQLAAAAVTEAKLAASVAGAGLTGGAGTALAVGAGAGISVAADAVALDTAVAVRKYAVAIGDNAASSFVITHSLNTQDVTVAVYLASGTFEEIGVDIQHTSVNTVTVVFTGVVPTAGQYRVVVHG